MITFIKSEIKHLFFNNVLGSINLACFSKLGLYLNRTSWFIDSVVLFNFMRKCLNTFEPLIFEPNV